jgi:hypothetical protein
MRSGVVAFDVVFEVVHQFASGRIAHRVHFGQRLPPVAAESKHGRMVRRHVISGEGRPDPFWFVAEATPDTLFIWFQCLDRHAKYGIVPGAPTPVSTRGRMPVRLSCRLYYGCAKSTPGGGNRPTAQHKRWRVRDDVTGAVW